MSQLVNKWESTDNQITLEQFRRNIRKLEKAAHEQARREEEGRVSRNGQAVQDFAADDAELESLFQAYDLE